MPTNYPPTIILMQPSRNCDASEFPPKPYETSCISMEKDEEQKLRKQSKIFTSTVNQSIQHFILRHSSAVPALPKVEPQPLSMARSIAMIIICVTAFIVNTASSLSINLLIPSIHHELDVEASDLQWISSGFPLGLGSCLLLFGRLADLYGHKLFIQLGTSLYALASLGCAISHNHVQLSVLRFLQGLSVAATTPSLIGVLGSHLEPDSALKRIGFASLSAGAPLGATFGLLAGGFITQGTGPGWRSFFYLSAASALCVSISATLIIPKDKHRANNEASIDWLGGILIITGLTALTFSLGISSREGWDKLVVLLPFTCSIIILASFIFWQKVLEGRMTESLQAGDDCGNHTAPILKLDLFRRDRHRFSVVLMVVALLWFGFVVQNFFFHQYLQDFLGLNLNQSTIRFIPMIVLGLLLNIAFGFISHVVPAQLLIVLGCVGTATSCLISALMDTSASYWTFNFASIALSVVGPDFVFATGTMYGSQISSQSEQAVTAGVFHTFAQMGNAIGLSIATLLQVQVTRSSSFKEGMIIENDLVSNSTVNQRQQEYLLV
ncbi:hypothetical protein KEM48_012861 [Puccinia striiformis f. sp. tritici PST-130]|uniref:Major facilitator superfamily (MFS) profile domain-containing protein n=1 Tax=Puccinia striiformis f. sp. tritici PST-78 TaxID=1165861 RepID=A0A0L0UT78_9BASI|nr:hypothetical protein KEM48_012861 [Puccinia striiformis f. sp. tritici PST-130]KNE90126.1 hypothetical protein PSTG_16431 [Puccinia striiformis f. sp. tritici PST-78]